ncbi:MAG: endonuclease III [Candidatus Omnitrophica bacterium]|nr:endonuclease III [Candidatus Omnitrophota bacterium]
MSRILRTIKLIEEQLKPFKIPYLKKKNIRADPYKVLVSCILSLRTKDPLTDGAVKRLFKVADNPDSILKLPLDEIQKLIYPVGFYRNKARYIKELTKQIIEDFSGKIPDNLKDLLKLKGVGLKTANLVLGRGFGIPAICVDTHVHRISNRLGWVKTKDPLQTERRLKRIIPKDYWIKINSLLVAFGQKICLPVVPLCSRCKVKDLCKRREIKKSR